MVNRGGRRGSKAFSDIPSTFLVGLVLVVAILDTRTHTQKAQSRAQNG